MGRWASSVFCETPSHASVQFLESLLAGYPRRDFQVRLWDGTTWGAESQPRFTLILRHPGALRAMFLSPSELALGEAYVYDDFDLEGDMDAAFDLSDYLLGQERSFWDTVEIAELLRHLPSVEHQRGALCASSLPSAVHSRDRDRQVVRYHYDLPVEFYALWLDPRLVYSCAYFASPDEGLNSAQVGKLEYVCRKLRLHPGERLLDIGCGWGGLITYAAEHYGVRAVGITLSVPQAETARRQVRDKGLTDRCRVEVVDYRDLDPVQQYDKIVSIGMFEHVGEAHLPEYFRRVWAQLRPGGTLLNHGIAYSATYRRKGPSFTDRYVFPDGELVPISATLRAAEMNGFEVRDVESLREHYALTLRHWVHRLQASADEARRITNDQTYRIWRLYMVGSAHGFGSGRLNLYQTLFSKPSQGQSHLPLTRNDWYRVDG